MTSIQRERRLRPDRRREPRRESEHTPGFHLFGIAELATQLGVTERFVRRLVAERRLPYCKIGKFVRFHPEDVENWINDRRVEAQEGEQNS